MYQSKKELQRKFETLQRKCKTLAIECKYWQNRYDELTTQCEKSNFCFTCQKMVSGTPGDIQSIVCENDIECKQCKRKV